MRCISTVIRPARGRTGIVLVDVNNITENGYLSSKISIGCNKSADVERKHAICQDRQFNGYSELLQVIRKIVV